MARKLGLGSSTATRRWSGEKISDCGSETCGHPAKTLGVHNGDSPRAREAARKRTCGRNCDLASHGIVTAPDSHGQAKTRQASAKIASVADSDRVAGRSRLAQEEMFSFPPGRRPAPSAPRRPGP